MTVFAAARRVTREAVELAHVGTWDGMYGSFTLNRADLEAAVAATKDPAFRAPRIKLGHDSPIGDAAPAFGCVQNLRLSEDGDRLLGDYANVPEWLADALDTHYPSRSIEGRFNAKSATSGKRFRFAVDAVALLGAEMPAISSLEDLQAVVESDNPMQKVAARAVFAVFTPPPRSEPRPQSRPQEEARMADISAIREALGLPDDATEETVLTTARELRAQQNSGGDEGETPPAQEPPAPAEADPNSEPSPETQDPNPAPAAPPGEQEGITNPPASGTVTVDAAEWQRVNEMAEMGVAARSRQITDDRERLLNDCVKAGKFPKSRIEHWRKLHTHDPEGTKTVLASLAANTVPLAPIGTTADTPAEASYPSHWLPEVKARNGNNPNRITQEV